MLDTHQMADLDAAKTDIENKQMILNTAIDVQALLRLLVHKGIITKEEMNQYREEVRKSSKYKAAVTYVDQTLREIEMYKRDSRLYMQEMFKRKMQGK